MAAEFLAALTAVVAVDAGLPAPDATPPPATPADAAWLATPATARLATAAFPRLATAGFARLTVAFKPTLTFPVVDRCVADALAWLVPVWAFCGPASPPARRCYVPAPTPGASWAASPRGPSPTDGPRGLSADARHAHRLHARRPRDRPAPPGVRLRHRRQPHEQGHE